MNLDLWVLRVFTSFSRHSRHSRHSKFTSTLYKVYTNSSQSIHQVTLYNALTLYKSPTNSALTGGDWFSVVTFTCSWFFVFERWLRLSL